MSILRMRQIPRPQRHIKPIIFPWKSIHFALHTEVNFKCHFCESSESVSPKERHMKPIIFLWKSIHFALHTEVNFKCHWGRGALQVAPFGARAAFGACATYRRLQKESGADCKGTRSRCITSSRVRFTKASNWLSSASSDDKLSRRFLSCCNCLHM